VLEVEEERRRGDLSDELCGIAAIVYQVVKRVGRKAKSAYII